MMTTAIRALATVLVRRAFCRIMAAWKPIKKTCAGRKIVEAIEKGVRRSEATRTFGVSLPLLSVTSVA